MPKILKEVKEDRMIWLNRPLTNMYLEICDYYQVNYKQLIEEYMVHSMKILALGVIEENLMNEEFLDKYPFMEKHMESASKQIARKKSGNRVKRS